MAWHSVPLVLFLDESPQGFTDANEFPVNWSEAQGLGVIRIICCSVLFLLVFIHHLVCALRGLWEMLLAGCSAVVSLALCCSEAALHFFMLWLRKGKNEGVSDCMDWWLMSAVTLLPLSSTIRQHAWLDYWLSQCLPHCSLTQPHPPPAPCGL